jgi:hypothetical protein
MWPLSRRPSQDGAGLSWEAISEYISSLLQREAKPVDIYKIAIIATIIIVVLQEMSKPPYKD